MTFIDCLLKIITSKLFYLPIIYIVVGVVIYKFIKKMVVALFNRQSRLIVNKKRYKTLLQIIVDGLKFIIILMVILSILTVYGVNVQSVLAGLGIVSVVIGLAFQDLFKDYIVGFSIIIEDYFSVGDTIKVGDYMGEVIYLGLKTTKIKNYDGSVMCISNRNIDKVINYNKSNSLAIVDVGVAYESDLDRVEDVLNKLFKRLNKKLEDLKGDIQISGVEKLDNSSIVYRITVETTPMKQFIVQRKLRKEIKDEFDKENVKIPYDQIEVHNGK